MGFEALFLSVKSTENSTFSLLCFPITMNADQVGTNILTSSLSASRLCEILILYMHPGHIECRK